MDRPRAVVPGICAAAFAAALLAAGLVASSASRDGRADLAAAARELTAALKSPRIRRDDVQRLLAPGYSVDDRRVAEVLAGLERSLEGDAILTHVRVGSGGLTGKTEFHDGARSFRRRLGEPLTYEWERTPGGRWGLVPLPR